MNAVLEWTKRNVFIIVFAVVMLAALISLPLLARSMNAEVRKDLDARVRKMNELKQIERTPIAPPGSDQTSPGVVTDKLLEAYRIVVESAGEDANRVIRAAVDHNSKGRVVLNSQLFPQPPRELSEVLPRRFHERLMAAYDSLLRDIRAGSPPELETLRDEIERHDAQFRLANFAKGPTDPLTEEEERALRQNLTELRLQKYRDSAAATSLYLDRITLELPAFSPAVSLAELYEWQWRYWIIEDVLRGLSDANREASSVLEAPVKHITFLRVLDHQIQAPRDQGGGGGSGPIGPMGGGPIGPMGGGPTGGGEQGGRQQDDSHSGPPQLPNPRAEIPLNYTASFTGRSTCALYDVRVVELELVVGTAALPAVLDALAQRNFITVTRLRLTPADPYEAARDGFVYGAAPVSHVSIQLETVWLREWTAPFMPAAVRRALGIQSQTAGGEDVG